MKTAFLTLPFLATLLSVGTVLGGPVTFIERAPADPRAVTVEVDQAGLTGELDRKTLTDLVEAGRQLFDTRFTKYDGAGRPLATQAIIPTHFKHPREILFQRASGPDSNGCVSCHNVPTLGGAGDFAANAFTSEGTESADFDNVDPQFSNERGSPSLFGAGLVELLAREMTADLQSIRREALDRARETGIPVTAELTSKGISFGELIVGTDGRIDVSGIEGVDHDLIVRPFTHKGTMISLRVFAVTALNTHFGIQPEERFGAQMTGMKDFDGDGMNAELSPGQISAMVAFQAALEPPVSEPFENTEWQNMADKGEKLFFDTGCAACHTPALPLESLKFTDPGPYDTAGTLASHDVADPAIYDLALLDWAADLPRDENGHALVPLFSDMKRHTIADEKLNHYGNELLSQGFVPRNTFLTTKLWGLADTAPYGHRADLTTIDAAILAHGGEATQSRDQYADLSDTERDNLITYLKTLRMPQ